MQDVGIGPFAINSVSRNSTGTHAEAQYRSMLYANEAAAAAMAAGQCSPVTITVLSLDVIPHSDTLAMPVTRVFDGKWPGVYGFTVCEPKPPLHVFVAEQKVIFHPVRTKTD